MRYGQHAPYAGLQKREIKALSEQQISDLRAGRGMSLAPMQGEGLSRNGYGVWYWRWCVPPGPEWCSARAKYPGA